MTQRWSIRTAVFMAPSIIIVLMIGTLLVFDMALRQQQAEYNQVVQGPITRATTTTTKLLLAVSDVQAAVMRYTQFQQRLQADDAILGNLREAILARYEDIASTFDTLKNGAVGRSESDVVANIEDFISIHRAVSTRIISGSKPDTMAMSTVMAHYQQLQGYIAELAQRSLESAEASVQTAEQAISDLSRALMLGSAIAILLSIGITVYAGRAIAMFDTVNQELHTHERSLNEARLTAESANAAKSAFLANVSHELRTPLTSILGFTQIIKHRFDRVIRPRVENGDPKIESAVRQIDENIDIILSEGDRLTALINNVLDLEKIESGQTMQWNISATEVNSVLEHATEATRPLYTSKGIALKTQVDANVTAVLADRDKLIQVLVNLISNAVKFTDHGHILCSARMRTPDWVEFTVNDTGCGIAAEDQGQVFDKFRQVGDTLTGKPSGTGLGLSICREIITRLGGSIWLESEPGIGSAFHFHLPAATAQDSEA